ncbi:anti-sigma factor domain-containing protein [Calderihabitans maritimus]|uniref:RsgI N-terminal anti-sigma domain-containing protein n=1 Tax=Calderihabitans maritimus TaxID=1246530 RepID=A0A1Z5HT57_9FIRM|nr:anti-sigma factor domain-containing protein [Calderihabitans maritimus]GAW92709.1 hypothetical protein HM1_1833 [Calderihabitans maritimus]
MKTKERKGLILEKTGDKVIILTPDGEFVERSARLVKGEIGDEIYWNTPVRFGGIGRRLLLVAVAVLFFFLLPGIVSHFIWLPVNQEAVAFVSVDINPSIEIALNRQQKVISASAFNDDGRRLLEGLKLKGWVAEKAIAMIIQEAARAGFFQPDQENTVILGVSPGGAEQEWVEKVERKLRNTARQTVEEIQVDALVETVRLTSEDRAQARKLGLSPGKYAIFMEAVASGLKVTVEDMREKSVAHAIKEAGGKVGEVMRRAHWKKNFHRMINKKDTGHDNGASTEPEGFPPKSNYGTNDDLGQQNNLMGPYQTKPAAGKHVYSPGRGRPASPELEKVQKRRLKQRPPKFGSKQKVNHQ